MSHKTLIEVNKRLTKRVDNEVRVGCNEDVLFKRMLFSALSILRSDRLEKELSDSCYKRNRIDKLEELNDQCVVEETDNDEDFFNEN